MDRLLLIWSNFYFQSLFKIILIVILAGIIGMERDKSNKPAGFRTYTLLGLSAVLVVICGEALSQRHNIDPFRIAAQFLSGIGFIGAGTILRDGFNVKGLTTASGLLTVSCIGLCVGAGAYIIALIATVFTYFVMSYSYLFSDKLDHFETIEIEFNIKEEVEKFMSKLEKICEEYDIELKEIDEMDNNKMKVVCKYNNRALSKNKILTELATIKNINNIRITSN